MISSALANLGLYYNSQDVIVYASLGLSELVVTLALSASPFLVIQVITEEPVITEAGRRILCIKSIQSSNYKLGCNCDRTRI